MKPGILNAIGNTPMVEVCIEDTHFMAKLECMNPFGSMKDRAAPVVLQLLNLPQEILLLHYPVYVLQ